jgi:hypothetical protein
MPHLKSVDHGQEDIHAAHLDPGVLGCVGTCIFRLSPA